MTFVCQINMASSLLSLTLSLSLSLTLSLSHSLNLSSVSWVHERTHTHAHTNCTALPLRATFQDLCTDNICTQVHLRVQCMITWWSNSQTRTRRTCDPTLELFRRPLSSPSTPKKYTRHQHKATYHCVHALLLYRMTCCMRHWPFMKPSCMPGCCVFPVLWPTQKRYTDSYYPALELKCVGHKLHTCGFDPQTCNLDHCDVWEEFMPTLFVLHTQKDICLHV